MIYSVTQLDLIPGGAAEAIAGLKEALLRAIDRITFLGCFYSEIGALNRVLIIHRGQSSEQLNDAVATILHAPDLPGIGPVVNQISVDYFRPFPNIPEMTTGGHGPIFEFRTYTLKPHGLPGTHAAWIEIINERIKFSKLLGVMNSLTGIGPRVLQIWPYPTIEERMTARVEAVKAGAWPPEGGRPRIAKMQSDIYLAADYSPIF